MTQLSNNQTLSKNRPSETILNKVLKMNMFTENIPFGFTPDREDCFGVSVISKSKLTGYWSLTDKVYTIKTGKFVSEKLIEDGFENL